MSYNLTNQAIEDSFQPLLQIDSGSALRDGSGSLVDNIIVTSSYALTASYAKTIEGELTSSFLVTASFNNINRNLEFTKGDSSTFLVSIPGQSGSVDWTDVTNKPSGLVSGSSQLTSSYDQRYVLSGSVQPLPSGVVSGSAQIDFNGISNVPSGLVSSSSQIDLAQTFGTASHAISASYAVSASYEIIKEISSSYADFAPYDGILNKPTLVSSSAQVSDLTASLLETASNDFSQITFTKGDGSQFTLDTTPRIVWESVKNGNGQILPKGTPVYASGSVGNAQLVFPASASNDATMPAVYILAQELGVGEEGYGITHGFINGVNTSLFNAGDEVYVGSNGGFTNQRPTGSSLIQKLGTVVRSDNNNGSGVIQIDSIVSVPNIQQGYTWVGDINGVAQPIPTSSIQTDVSGLVTTSSFNQYTSSNDSKVQSLIDATGSYATTGSNTFIGNQTITGSVFIQNATETALVIKGSPGDFNPVIIEGGPDFVTKFTPSKIIVGDAQINRIISDNLDISGSNFWQTSDSTGRLKVGINGSQKLYAIGFDTLYNSSNYTYVFRSGSTEFKTNLDVRDTLSSRQAESNVIYNPQLITENITIPTNKNAFMVGEVTISGDLTLDTGSQLYIHTPADLADYLTEAEFTPISASFDSRINSLPTTGSNTFIGNQVISGSFGLNSPNGAVIIRARNPEPSIGKILIDGTEVQINSVNPVIFNTNSEFNGAFLLNSAFYQSAAQILNTSNEELSNTADFFEISLNNNDVKLNINSMLGLSRTINLFVKQGTSSTGSLQLTNSSGATKTLYGVSGSILPDGYLDVSQVTGSLDYFEIKSIGSYLTVTNYIKQLQNSTIPTT